MRGWRDAPRPPGRGAELLATAPRSSLRGLEERARAPAEAEAEAPSVGSVPVSVIERLEIHHTTRVTDDGISSLETEFRICAHHHDLITHKKYELEGSHQAGWWLTPPDRAPPPDTG